MNETQSIIVYRSRHEQFVDENRVIFYGSLLLVILFLFFMNSVCTAFNKWRRNRNSNMTVGRANKKIDKNFLTY